MHIVAKSTDKLKKRCIAWKPILLTKNAANIMKINQPTWRQSVDIQLRPQS